MSQTPSPEATPSANQAPRRRPGEDFQVKSLKWLMNNATHPEDKVWARKVYLNELFHLWRKHVASTGETFYPPLRNDLHDHFEVMSDHNHG